MWGPGARIAVPALAGVPQDEAEGRLTDAGLEARVTLEESDDVAKGLVIATDPGPGTRLREGSIVELRVSSGVRMAVVPEQGVVGATLSDAQAALTEAGLDGEVGVEQVFDTVVPADVVISVDPPGGEEVPHNSPLTLVVSKGPEPVDAPDLTGMTLDQAALEAGPLELTVESGAEEYSETVPEGQIISQNPPAGSKTHRGAKITVVVSLGMPFVEVPDLAAKTWDAASAELTARGLVAERTGVEFLHVVQRTIPAAGTQVRKGSTVTLVMV
jgi:serine/threonine-protein kinase